MSLEHPYASNVEHPLPVSVCSGCLPYTQKPKCYLLVLPLLSANVVASGVDCRYLKLINLGDDFT